MLKLSQRGIVHFLIPIILITGLIAGLYLVQKAQIFKPKASENQLIQVIDSSGNPITETKETHIALKLTLPEGWKLPDQQDLENYGSDSKCPAKPNNACCQQPLQACESNDDERCKEGFKWCYQGYCVDQNSAEHPYAGRTNLNCKSEENLNQKVLKLIFISNVDSDGYNIGNFLEFKGNFEQILSQPMGWDLETSSRSSSDNGKRTVSVSYLCHGCTEYRVYAQADIQLVKQVTPAPSVPSVSDQPAKEPESNLVATPALTEIKEYSVQFLIHPGLDFNQASSWANDTLNNYINPRLIKAGISKRFKYIGSDVYRGIQCPREIDESTPGENCPFVPGENIIKVWMYPRGIGSKPEQAASDGVAKLTTASVGIVIPPSNNIAAYSDENKNLLMHELMHLFLAQDYYNEDVHKENNYSGAKISISAFVKDVMYWWRYSSDLSSVTASFVNQVEKIPIQGGGSLSPIENASRSYIPADNVLLVHNNGVALEGVQVEVFPQTIFYNFQPPRFQIVNEPKFSGLTNAEGKFELGNISKLFSGRTGQIGYSALLRLTNRGQVRYASITRSQLYNEFFKGNISQAVIPQDFNKLLEYKENQINILSRDQVGLSDEIILTDEDRVIMDAERQNYLQSNSAIKLGI